MPNSPDISLRRLAPGRYRTLDDRFEINRRQTRSDTNWLIEALDRHERPFTRQSISNNGRTLPTNTRLVYTLADARSVLASLYAKEAREQ